VIPIFNMNREILCIMPIKLATFALTIILLLSSPFLGCSQPLPVNMPKDAQLVELFRSHRDAFEKLASMGMEDAGTVSHLSVETLNEEPLTDGRQNLAAPRRGEYKRLLSSIRSDLAMGFDPSGAFFSYWRGGTGLSIGRSWEKGIAYLPDGYEKVGILVTNLDKPPTQDDIYLVAIEPKWYIYYSQLD
jgi:hypothetical protein